MTPPETDQIGKYAEGSRSAADLSCPIPTVLTQRRDFQRASRGQRVAMAGFILQALRRPEGEADGIRIGYTCSKKVGNAVARNRAKRRLREVARSSLPSLGKSGHDYVLVGRNTSTASLPFAQLMADMEKALAILHGSRS
ncbi:ribonuclease P protein component [Sulfitobacter guttiformis]|uniref:Ribonuclease P protein component n=1 Tax=Sulfitobacter guttiformis TaxID=74349 RepID=A0A420DQ97_9RHOB|nr:ribonuclease P protein component [Sulfitobacter guttiformis]KIN73823.1 Ribonuclease P protein component [Sulfitobacter guttiformis KCTC 32187]RKE96456.1 ribonuclease P protein component [Sulfitobacter guttiformis]